MSNDGQTGGARGWITWIGLPLSGLALTVFLFILPRAEEDRSRSESRDQYLLALVGSGGSAHEAVRWAQGNTHAYHFAETLGVAWEALQDSETSFTSDGTVTPLSSGAYEVCLPKLDVFGDHCPEFANFEFTDDEKLTRFTVDGEPVEQVFRFREYGMSITDDEGSAQMRAFSAGVVRDTASGERVLLLSIDRSFPVTSGGEGVLAFSSVAAFDEQRRQIPVIAEHFPAAFSSVRPYFAAVRVPDAARNLYVCWNGAPEGEETCDWVVAPS